VLASSQTFVNILEMKNLPINHYLIAMRQEPQVWNAARVLSITLAVFLKQRTGRADDSLTNERVPIASCSRGISTFSLIREIMRIKS